MIMVVAGSVGDFVALAFANQALVASLAGSVGAITNVLLAWKWNGDSFFVSDAVGVAFIITGAVWFA